MEAFINNQSVVISDSASLGDLLAQQDLLEKKGIAVAVNNQVVPKSEWGNYKLLSADKITVIRATQGG